MVYAVYTQRYRSEFEGTQRKIQEIQGRAETLPYAVRLPRLWFSIYLNCVDIFHCLSVASSMKQRLKPHICQGSPARRWGSKGGRSKPIATVESRNQQSSEQWRNQGSSFKCAPGQKSDGEMLSRKTIACYFKSVPYVDRVKFDDSMKPMSTEPWDRR